MERFLPGRSVSGILYGKALRCGSDKNDVLLPQCGQYLLFIDADTLFQLAVYFLVDFGYQLHGRLYALFIAMRGAVAMALWSATRIL